MSSIHKGSSSLPATWGVLVLSGAGCCLASLLLGLWGVRDYRRRSVAIGDPNLLAEVELLCRSLSVAGHVEVRELSSAAGSTAAAAGWLRPFILFPHDWRSWSSLEHRAVLAHELAHIARADYASGIVAQLGLALHFYHPLIHWMVARLRLQQELAADALGAACGRAPFLRPRAFANGTSSGGKTACLAGQDVPAVRRPFVQEDPNVERETARTRSIAVGGNPRCRGGTFDWRRHGRRGFPGCFAGPRCGNTGGHCGHDPIDRPAI